MLGGDAKRTRLLRAPTGTAFIDFIPDFSFWYQQLHHSTAKPSKTSEWKLEVKEVLKVNRIVLSVSRPNWSRRRIQIPFGYHHALQERFGDLEHIPFLWSLTGLRSWALFLSFCLLASAARPIVQMPKSSKLFGVRVIFAVADTALAIPRRKGTTTYEIWRAATGACLIRILLFLPFSFGCQQVAM